MNIFYIIIISTLVILTIDSKEEWIEDPRGYIVYCPCMGRFGNQAEMFLGALQFAKSMKRTLILPPWVEYNFPSKNTHIPFSTYFSISALQKYTEVIGMEEFMEHLSSKVWPKDKRIITCYSGRDDSDSCQEKDGNPFGPFWDHFHIDFVKPSHFEGLSWLGDYDVWNVRFPASKYKVIAFTGTPGNFPVDRSNVRLHRYLEWSPGIRSKRDAFVTENLAAKPVLAVHFRHGTDWPSVCTHLDNPSLFASAQCLGYSGLRGKLNYAMCNPDDGSMLRQIKRAIKRLRPRTVFVAADQDHMISKIQKISGPKVKVVRDPSGSPHTDLALLAIADHYIGNCVSTFAAFVVRERREHGLSVEFWGRDYTLDVENAHDEL